MTVVLDQIWFLSTPPSRVATCKQVVWHNNHPVSIHATLAGGDPRCPAGGAAIAGFYPRHPRGWRPYDLGDAVLLVSVSIHATLAGGDGIPD